MPKLDQVSVNGTTYEIVPEVAPLFNTSTAYAVGDYVIKDAVLYRFKATHTSGAWSASQVDEVTAGSELKSIKNDKLDKNQGTANAGKYLKVSANGNVETVELDITTDTTLSIADKAADAKAVGDEIDVLKADLGTYSEFAFFTPTIDEVQRNLTFSITNDGKLKVYGSPSAARRLCCLNGQDVIKTTSGEFAKTLDAGTYIISTSVTGYSSYVRWDYTYTTFASYQFLVTNENPEITITFEHPVMIGFTFGQVQGENYGTSENPTYITFSAKKLTAVDVIARKSIESLQVAEGTAWTE